MLRFQLQKNLVSFPPFSEKENAFSCSPKSTSTFRVQKYVPLCQVIAYHLGLLSDLMEELCELKVKVGGLKAVWPILLYIFIF